jgi:FlaA1/EpsC-like NDP-sugar epimerase
MIGGEIYVKKIPSMTITQIAEAVRPGAAHTVVGIRPGEKLNEQMIGPEDAAHTYEYEDYFKIIPAIHNWSKDPVRIREGKAFAEDFSYVSDTNTDWMSTDDLASWVSENRDKIGKF